MAIGMQLYRFTNIHGRQRHGVCLEMVANGANILADTWQPNEKVTVPANYAYVSFAPNPYVMDNGRTKTELLPLDTLVTWQTPEIAQIVAMMQSGTFDAWWPQHRAEIVKKFIGGYKVK